jgi:diaminohydroxyphosphoribosylaminopyrimidine deaminase/5-amino-6-(5-phosphoribosylamino)uracil reductase
MAIQTHLSDILALGRPAAAEPAVDETFMRRALELAWRAAGRTRPNPMVGAVVVAGGRVVGEGYHQRCGEAHGEVVALDDAGEGARGATMYVTLEPCAHHGRTPPCVDRILDAGVSRVVMTTLDPDGRVDGRGVEILRRAGVRVDVGCLSAAAVVQNPGYYGDRLGLGQTVTLKMAATMDGKIASAPGRRDDVTGAAARVHVHAMRALHDCVVVGADTVLVDTPRLDCRLADTDPSHPLAVPVPVLLDSRLRIGTENRWTAEGRRFVVVTGPDAPADRRRALEDGGATVLACDPGPGGVSIPGALDALATEGFSRVMVEGGASVFTSFLNSGCWDALYLFQSTRWFGESGVPLVRGERSDGQDAVDGVLVDSTEIDGDVMHRFLSTRARRAMLSRVDRDDGEGR